MRLLVFLALLCGALPGRSQGSNLPLGNPAYHTFDRLEVKTGLPAPQHGALKYFTRAELTQYALALDSLPPGVLSPRDRWDLHYIFVDNNEWLGQARTNLPLARRRYDPTEPTLVQLSLRDSHYVHSRRPLLERFYRTPANLFEVSEPHFYFRLNPVLNLGYGRTNDPDGQPYFLNQRGVEARGGIDDRVYFYFNILESQAHFPRYVDDWANQNLALPGNGLTKNYTSTVFGIKNGYDYLNSQGYVGFHLTNHLGAQLGYGRHFIGHGYRSLVLSDFSDNYPYLKLNWRVWRFHYQNLFAELTALSARNRPGAPGEVLPRKYMAAHHLSIDLTPSLNVGVFEAIVYSRSQGGLEFRYLNPIILYRAAEQGLDSPDNVLIGLTGRWNLLRRFQLYGQLVLDEFVFSELFVERRGWWANKFGIQAGLKYIDALGIDHLDLQAEINLARPYTYTHRDSLASYTHYNQPLAHPLGANFRELLLRAQYRPTNRLFLDARLFWFGQGEEAPNRNFGANLMLSHQSRVADYGVELLQGVRADTWLGVLDVGYQLRHNLWLEAQLLLRDKQSADPTRSRATEVWSLGVRWNTERVRMEF